MDLNWYDKLLDFAKQKSSIVVWFFISSGVLLFAPVSLLTLIRVDKIIDYIGPVAGLVFLLSSVLIIINIVVWASRKIRSSKDKKEVAKHLQNLTDLYSIKEVETGFKSQNDAISWSNKVAPLLRFNEQYYRNFLENSHKLNINGLSGQLLASSFNIMKSQVQMAIEELQNEVK